MKMYENGTKNERTPGETGTFGKRKSIEKNKRCAVKLERIHRNYSEKLLREL